MGEIVNLRQARKRAIRAERERAAAENRVIHGRNKVQKLLAKAERERAEATLDGHRLERTHDKDGA